MFKRIKNTVFLLIFFIFIFLISSYYFSDKNITLTNKLRSSYSTKLNDEIRNLPVLINNTQNIIVYMNDLEEFKKKRKKRFWERLISNENE